MTTGSPSKPIRLPILRGAARRAAGVVEMWLDQRHRLPAVRLPNGALRILGRFHDMEQATAAAKGDVLVHNGTTYVRLGVGSNAQVLTADSTEDSGAKWAAAGGGGADEKTATLGGALSTWQPVAVSWSGNASFSPANGNIVVDTSPASLSIGCWNFNAGAHDYINASHHGDAGRSGGFYLPAGLSTVRVRWMWGVTSASNSLAARWHLRVYQAAGATYTAAGMSSYTALSNVTLTAATNDCQETTLDATISGYNSTKPVFVVFGREGPHANDTLNQTARVVGLSLECQ